MSSSTTFQKALCLLLVLTVILPGLSAIAPARKQDRFSSGLIAEDITFTASEPVRTVSFTVPSNADVEWAGLEIGPRPDDDGSYPLDLEVDVGQDGNVEWSYSGLGLGEYGRQVEFADGLDQSTITFKGPSMVKDKTVRLPVLQPGASVERAVFQVEGLPEADDWWDLNWSYRTGVWVNDTNGQGFDGIVAEFWLDVEGLKIKNVDEFRVTSVGLNGMETERRIQVIDEEFSGGYITDVHVVFDTPAIAPQSVNRFFIYYGNPGAAASPLATDFKAYDIRNRFANNLTEEMHDAEPKSFNKPTAIEVDDDGNMYISDTNHHVVSLFDPYGQHIRDYGMKGIQGNDDVHLSGPRHSVLDWNGNLIISDAGNDRLQVFDPNGTYVTTMMGGPFTNGTQNVSDPSGLIVHDDVLYVAMTGHYVVYMYDDDYSFNTSYFYPGVKRTDDYSFTEPTDVAITPSGEMLYVIDTGSNRIDIFDTGTNLHVESMGIVGVDDFVFFGPRGVCLNDNGFFVADSKNNRVQIIRNGALDGEIGIMGKTGVNTTRLDNPQDIVEKNGVTYIVDTGNNRVLRMYDLQASVGGLESIYPSDVSIDIGGDNIPEFEVPGPLIGTKTAQDFSSRLELAMTNTSNVATVDGPSGINFIELEMTVSTATQGSLRISGIEILYEHTSLVNCTEAVMEGVANAKLLGLDNAEIPVMLTSTHGKIRLSNLTVEYDLPPEQTSMFPSTWALPEDTNATFEVHPYFKDDMDAALDLTYTVVSSEPGSVHVDFTEPGFLFIDAAGASNWYGAVNVTIEVGNSRGLSVTSGPFSINVTPVNDHPYNISIPPPSVYEGEEYLYIIQAGDHEGDDVTFTINTAPKDMVLDPQSGEIRWTPTNDHVGPNKINIEISDGKAGGTFNHVFFIEVLNRNDPPAFLSIPPEDVFSGEKLTYVIRISDPDRADAIQLTFDGPKGMSLEGSDRNYTLSWVPGTNQVGKHDVELKVTDGTVSIFQNFTIEVKGEGDPGVMGMSTGFFYTLILLMIIIVIALVAIVAVRSKRRKDMDRTIDGGGREMEVEEDRKRTVKTQLRCRQCGSKLDPEIDYCVECGAMQRGGDPGDDEGPRTAEELYGSDTVEDEDDDIPEPEPEPERERDVTEDDDDGVDEGEDDDEEEDEDEEVVGKEQDDEAEKGHRSLEELMKQLGK